MKNNNTSQVKESKATTVLMKDTAVSGKAYIEETHSAEHNKDEQKKDFYPKELAYSPYLLRLSTGEKVNIVQKLFKIGKKADCVDYAVQGNSAVSRIHAELVRNKEHFFIRDNYSTNGTYIWNVKIPPKENIEIFDGDELKFANETFQFHLL